MHQHPDAKAVVRTLAPDEPVICNRPHAAARAARFFAERFPGKSMYAVKANPSPELLQILWDAGITHFDVASIAEVRLGRVGFAGLTDTGVPASVTDGGLETSLLGMSYLDRFARIEIAGDRMRLVR